MEGVTERRGRPAPWGLALAIVGLTLATFQHIRHHDFVYFDDVDGLARDGDLAAETLPEAVRRAWTRSLLSNWIPVTTHSHQLDVWLHGWDAGDHLVTSLALHTAASVLLLGALVSLTGARARSALVAALFAIHPLHVETVAWIAERKGVLSGVFFAATLWAYAAWVKRPSGIRYAGVLGALALALLSKPTTVTLPCVLLLLDYWPLRRLDAAAWREKVPMFGFVLAVSVVTFLVQHREGAMSYGVGIPTAELVANAVAACASYLSQAFWPADLAALYPFPLGQPRTGEVAIGAAVLLGGTAVSFALRRSRPYLLVGWLWFLGMLVPTLGLIQVGWQAHADRYMYLPLIGLSIACVWAGADLARHFRVERLAAGAAALAVCALAVASWHQSHVWRDGRSLWSRVLAVSPGNEIGLVGLASVEVNLGGFAEAEALFEEAYARNPAFAAPYRVEFLLHRAAVLAKRGSDAQALEDLRLAARIGPDEPAAHAQLGLALMRQGRHDEAREPLEQALSLAPDSVRVQVALASIAQREGRFADAIALRRDVLARDPDGEGNLNDLAWLLATSPAEADRDPAEALRLARRLVDGKESPSANLLDTLAAACAADGRFEEAVELAERARLLAREAGDERLAEIFASRSASYRRGVPYREPVPDAASRTP